MTDILQANIFFFVASVATIAFCIIVILIMYQVLRITQSIRAIINRIESQSEQIATDINTVRNFVRQGTLVRTLFNFFTKPKNRRRRVSNTHNNTRPVDEKNK